MTLAALGGERPHWATVLVYARQMAEVFANTEFVPKAMRGQPDTIAAAICYGDELGITPAMALQSIDVVEGRPRPSASLARGLILAAGHSLVVHEMTGQRCRISGLRAGRPESERLTVEWSMDMARAAGLDKRPNWRSYPRAMLAARASSDLANLLFPDVLKGLTWVSEEPESLRQLEAWVPERDAPVAPPLEPPRRKTRPRRPTLPAPGHTLATEEHPGPDGSVDVELPQEPVDVSDLPEVELPAEAGQGPDPDGGPRPMTKGQAKLLQVLLTQCLGTSSTPEERHQLQGLILGREVTTSKTHTEHDAAKLLDVLGKISRDELELVLERGEWRIQEPPGQEGEVPPWTGVDPWSDLGGGGHD